MTPFRVTLALVLVLVAVLLAAGCVGSPPHDDHLANQTSSSDGLNSAVIRLDSENVSPDDRVGFSLSNETLLRSLCPNYIPSYGIEELTDKGSWVWLPEPRATIGIPVYYTNTGPQTTRYTFSTNGWKPGRYRIQLDCGTEPKMFEVRESSLVSCPYQQKSTLWITISPEPDPYVGDIFEIKGTTNLPVGTNLSFVVSEPSARLCPFGECIYTYLTGTMNATSGDCGINTWSYALNLSGVSPTCNLANCDPNHYVLWVGTVDRAVSNYTSIRVHGGQKPLHDYLEYTMIRGEPFSLQGVAPDPSSGTVLSVNGTPGASSGNDAAISEIHVWLFGNKYANMTVLPVNPDKSFNIMLTRFQTAELASGSYRMLLQYPKMKNLFDIRVQNGTYNVINANGEKFLNFYDIPDSKITGFKVMDILEQELKKPDSQDKYSVISLIVRDSPDR
jgi:hypothetical protein